MHLGSLSPTVSGSVGRTPYRCHSLSDGSKCRRGKGLKTVCIAPTRTSDTNAYLRQRYLRERLDQTDPFPGRRAKGLDGIGDPGSRRQVFQWGVEHLVLQRLVTRE